MQLETCFAQYVPFEYRKYYMLTKWQRQRLLQQVRDRKFIKDITPYPVENFTMSLEELEKSTVQLLGHMNNMMLVSTQIISMNDMRPNCTKMVNSTLCFLRTKVQRRPRGT